MGLGHGDSHDTVPREIRASSTSSAWRTSVHRGQGPHRPPRHGKHTLAVSTRNSRTGSARQLSWQSPSGADRRTTNRPTRIGTGARLPGWRGRETPRQAGCAPRTTASLIRRRGSPPGSPPEGRSRRRTTLRAPGGIAGREIRCGGRRGSLAHRRCPYPTTPTAPGAAKPPSASAPSRLVVTWRITINPSPHGAVSSTGLTSR